ncbi:hypothetical protein IBX65_07260 [Candidatus Aerophobetes bacterium]|nr:hypothetical protein [Candidatus Aerophobetes bacterium]
MKTIKIENEVYNKVRGFSDTQGFTLKDGVAELVGKALSDMVARSTSEVENKVESAVACEVENKVENEVADEVEKPVTQAQFNEFLRYFNGPEFLGELNKYEKKVDLFLEQIDKLEKKLDKFGWERFFKEVRTNLENSLESKAS